MPEQRYAVCAIVNDPVHGWASAAIQINTAGEVSPSGLRAFDTVSEFAVHPSGHPQEGEPVETWCLSVLWGDDFTVVDGNADIDLLPSARLDQTLSSIPVRERTAMMTALRGRGAPEPGLPLSAPFRDLVRDVGRGQTATFDPDRFHVRR